MKTILSLLFINNLAVSNAQVFNEYEYALQYDRNIEEYKLSYYFDNVNSSGFNEYKKTIAKTILRKLGLGSIPHGTVVWNKLLKIENDLQTSASEESINNFNTIKAKKNYADFNKLDAQLTARISTHNGENTLLDPKLKKAIDDSYGFISLEKNEMKKKILAFYNFMYELFGDHVEKMLYNFDYYPDLPANTYAATSNFYEGSCLTLGKIWNNKKMLKKAYMDGDASSGELDATFVHEFGHAIHNFLAVRANHVSVFTWDIYNTNNTRLLNPKCSQMFTNPSEELVPLGAEIIFESINTFISQKINQRYGFTDTAAFEFASWTMMMSGYAAIHDDKPAEYFAEAFAKWYHTPDSQKNIFWEWLHEYFTKELISQFVE